MSGLTDTAALTANTSESQPRALERHCVDLLAAARSNGHARYARGLTRLIATVEPIERPGKLISVGHTLTLETRGRERTYAEATALLAFAAEALSLP